MKANPLESDEERYFEKIGLIASLTKESSEDSFDDEEFGSGDYDITDEDKGIRNVEINSVAVLRKY